MHHRDRTKGRRSQSKRKLIPSRWSGPIEALEVRRLLDDSPSTTLYPISALYSTPVSSTGWAQLPTQTNGWIVYVSSSEGDDGNTGHDPDHPVATIAKAKTLMRDGKDDEMLLLRGDVWDEPIGTWSTSGVSATDPQVISYYSSDPNNQLAGDRPLIDSGTSDGITFVGHASNIAIIGLQFSPNSINGESYDGTNSTGVAGMRFQLQGSNYLVEDCLVDGYKDNIVVGNPGSPVTDFVLHRSESLDSYNATGAHSQGLYVSGGVLNGSDPCNEILIQENTFDHNGWNDNVAGADKTFFNHNMYINTGATNVQVLDNTITRGALRGTLLRAGGVVEGNFYDQNAVGIQVDNTQSTVENNVILEGDDLPSLPSGVGIDVDFDIPNVDIENNIIAHDISDYTSNVSGINLNDGTQIATVAGNIIYDWRRPLIDDGDGRTTVTGNDLEEFDDHHAVINLRGTAGTYSNNTYYDPTESQSFEIGDNVNNKISYNSWKSQTNDTSTYIGDNAPEPDYLDPNRSMATYAASVGLPAAQQTFDGWVAAQRNQSRGNWDTNFTAAAEGQYIRAGFTPAGSTIASTLPRVNVTASPLQITETGSPTTFTFQRVDGGNKPITTGTMSVNYAVTGTATNGVDYTLSPSTVFFADGQSSTTVTISPIHDKNPDGSFNVEQPETVRLQVTASSANPVTYVPGLLPSATITINDSDGGNVPVTPPNSGGGSSPTPPTDNSGGSGGESGSPATGTGLTVKYYNNQDLVGSPVYTNTVTNIGIADTNGAPAGTSGVNATHYSAVWTGEIQPAKTGNYTFTISVDADAAVRLFVDDGSDDDEAQIDLRPNHKMADANDDATVNSSDFAVIAAHFGQTGTYWDTGDFNGDGITNALDFNALATNYGTPDTRMARTLTGTVFLEAGAGYAMRLEYSQKVGDSKLDFSWTPPGSSAGSVPSTRLYPGHGAGAISVFAPDMSDSAQAAALPAAVPSGSVFSSTPITNDKDVLG